MKIFHSPCQWLTLHQHFQNFTLTFKQFVTCVLFNAKSESKKSQKRLNAAMSLDLSARVAGIRLDQHWAPQYHLSKPCDTRYTLIGKHEHFVDDLSASIRLLKLNATVESNEKTTSNKYPLSYWYNQLDSSMISDLQELYRLDFEMFGYNATPPS